VHLALGIPFCVVTFVHSSRVHLLRFVCKSFMPCILACSRWMAEDLCDVVPHDHMYNLTCQTRRRRSWLQDVVWVEWLVQTGQEQDLWELGSREFFSLSNLIPPESLRASIDSRYRAAAAKMVRQAARNDVSPASIKGDRQKSNFQAVAFWIWCSTRCRAVIFHPVRTAPKHYMWVFDDGGQLRHRPNPSVVAST